jgi:hypothetical protein
MLIFFLRRKMMIKVLLSYLTVAIISTLLAFCQPVAASTPAWIVEQSRGKVDNSTAIEIIEAVNKHAGNYGVNPKLIFKIIWVESRFNKKAVSKANAKGLMQVMGKYHKQRYTGENIFSIETNVRVGVEIFKEYRDSNQCSGNEICGLRRYYGDRTSNRYPNKIYAVNVPDITYQPAADLPAQEEVCQPNDYLDFDIPDCKKL